MSNFTPILPAPLEINGNQVKVCDIIKIKVPGITRLKTYVVRDIDLIYEMVCIHTAIGDKWITASRIVKHYTSKL